MTAPIHSVVQDQSEEFCVIDEVQLCIPQFDSRAAGLPEHHSDDLVDGDVEAPLIAPGFNLLDGDLHMSCDCLQVPSGPSDGTVYTCVYISNQLLFI